MTTNATTDTDLHDTIHQALPDWGPDVPGTLVEMTHPDGTVELSYAWRDGRATVTLPDRKRRTSPRPWDQERITALLAEDGSAWPEVSAAESARLGNALVGARAWSRRGGLVGTAEVDEVDDEGWVYAEDGYILAAHGALMRVHPADLAAAREAAAPKPPTCWDEWESGDVWVWGDVVYRMGDDRVLRLATIGGRWLDALLQPGGAWPTVTLTAPTEEGMARVAAADEAARLPDEPPLGSFVLDRDGNEWFRTVDGWRGARSGWCWEWAALHERRGPVAVIHRAAS